ncbi:MAG: AMP-binding protein [Burkholderiaceae bacterium]|nr:AMP-binding protein [Burkholderiaceae bacterium]
MNPAPSADTFPRLLVEHARVRPNATAIREKDLGIWQSWTWRQMLQEVSEIAAGLMQAGFKRGQHLAIIGENRPRLYFTMTAVQCLGGIPVPMYQDAAAAEMVFVFDNAEIRFAVVEDQEQVDKVLEVREKVPHLQQIFYDDARGLRHYQQAGLQPYEALRVSGQQWLKQNPATVSEEIAKGRATDIGAMFYTSGTTGDAKGVVLGYDNLIAAGRAGAELEALTANEDVLAYLPMAWIGQNIFSYTQWLVCGFTVNCPESAATVTADTREIGPTYYFAPPRVLEAMLTQVMIRMEDASGIKRRMFHYFMGVARHVGGRLLDKQPVGLGDRLLYSLGNWFVYAPLRNSLGMSRVRVAYTAGEAIGPDLFTFYRSLGINLKQLYGSTETSVFVCVQENGGVKADTVGPPVKGVEIKLSDAGEILIRSPGLFREYYKAPQATREAKDAEGWFHTGDAGYFDQGGHLKIIDRAKDVGKLADGTLFAPKYIENKLKFFPTIKEAVAFGDQRAMVTAFINIDMEAVGNWAERHNLPYAGYTDLAAKPEVLALVREAIGKVNADLAADPKLANAQIHRFIVLHKELDADDDELTRTRKVRRGFIQQKFDQLVAAMYCGLNEQYIETAVKFEDGRTGQINATLKIIDAEVFSVLQKAA